MVTRNGILLDIRTIDRVITPPTIDPITLAEVKQQLRFTSSSEDNLLLQWISAARQHFEATTGRQLCAATCERRLEGFPVGVIELPRPPLLSVESVSYIAPDGVEQTLVAGTDFEVEQPSGDFATRGFVRTLSAWPATHDEGFDVRVRYIAGYGTAASDVPALARAALFMLVANLHKYRAAVQETSDSLSPVPLGYSDIVARFQYTAVALYPPQRARVA